MREKGSLRNLLVNVAAALCAIVIATGVLAIGIVVFAAINGDTVADVYLEAFPRFRGSSGPAPVSGTTYAVFVGYIVAAAQISLIFRRKIASWWRA